MVPDELRLLAQFDFPARVVRVWDGSHVLLTPDAAGVPRTWLPLAITGGLEDIEGLINGQDQSLKLMLTGKGPVLADTGYADFSSAQIVGTLVTFSVQEIRRKLPLGLPEVLHTAVIVDHGFAENAGADDIEMAQWVELRSEMAFRNVTGNHALSNANHQAEHPGDLFCERTPELADKTIRWPDF